jgi:hypothetical protein
MQTDREHMISKGIESDMRVTIIHQCHNLHDAELYLVVCHLREPPLEIVECEFILFT